MTDRPTPRLAVIGLGMATKPHLDALVELRGRVEVSGVFNRTRAKAEAVRERFGFPVFDSLDAIAADPAAPTFANTIEAMERADEVMDKVAGVFFNLTSSNSNPSPGPSGK